MILIGILSSRLASVEKRMSRRTTVRSPVARPGRHDDGSHGGRRCHSSSRPTRSPPSSAYTSLSSCTTLKNARSPEINLPRLEGLLCINLGETSGRHAFVDTIAVFVVVDMLALGTLTSSARPSRTPVHLPTVGRDGMRSMCRQPNP